MRDVAAPGEITPEMLSQTFPQWRIFRVAVQWWATREGLQKLMGPQSLIRLFLVAPDLPALAEMLCLQDYLDRLTPETLAAVYECAVLSRTGRPEDRPDTPWHPEQKDR